MKNLKYILLSLIALTLLFAACTDLSKDSSGSQEKTEYTLLGSLSLAGVSRAAYSRTATSSFSDDLSWTITAKKGEKSYLPKEMSDTSFSFAFEETGEYTIEAKALKDGQAIAQGSTSCTVSKGGDNFAQIIATPHACTIPGSVNLVINLDTVAADNVASVYVEWQAPDIDRTVKLLGFPIDAVSSADGKTPEISEEVQAAMDAFYAWKERCGEGEFNKSFDVVNGKVTISFDEIFCGANSVNLSFNDSIGNTLYSCPEIINVYSGFTTDTWYGTAPYLAGGKFTLKASSLSSYGAEIVPSTQMVLYRNVKVSDDGDRRIDYYLTDDASMLITDDTAATVATAEGSPDFTFVFDSKGDVYTLAKRLGSASYIKSNNTDFGKETFGNGVLPNSMYLYGDNGGTLVMDRVNDVLYIYDDSSNTLTQIASDDGTYDYDGAAGIYYFAKTYSFSEDDNSNTMRNNSALTIVDKIAYFAATEEDYDEEIEKSIAYIKLVIADLNNATQGGGTNSYEYTGSKLVSINLTEMGLSNHAEVNDILYQDGCIYMLVSDKYEDFSAQLDDDFNPTDVIEGEIINRGTVVKYDIISGESTHLPFETTATSQQKIYPIGGTSSGEDYRLYNRNNYDELNPTAATYTPVLYDVTGHTGAKIDVYSHISEDTSSKVLYSPKKFIAIRPKKLIIADDGIAYYVDSLGGLRYKNENRVVEVDLESFAISKVEVATVAFNEDITGDITSSPVMGEAFSHGTQYFYNPESDNKDANGYVPTTSEIGNFFPGILSEED